MISPERVLEIARSLPCPLLVDEAYVDFAETNCVGLVEKCEKVMVSRSFSKSYALAGLRFGYLIARPNLIEQFVKLKDSYNCDAFRLPGPRLRSATGHGWPRIARRSSPRGGGL